MKQNSFLLQIDQAHLGWFHLKLLLLSGFCWSLAAYGVTIVGFLLPSLRAEWQVSSSELAWLASVGMLGMLVGSFLAGSLADRVGRRNTLALTLLFLGLTFILGGIAWNYRSLLVIRFFMGIGLGAIMPVSSTLIIEFAPARSRGTMSVLMNAFWGLGGTLAALTGYSLVLRAGWRQAMFLGGFALLISPIIRWALPESVRFLLAKGQVHKACLELGRLGLNGPSDPEIPAAALQPAEDQPGKSSGGIWSPTFARITFTVWFLWFALNFLYQGAFIWLPTLLASTAYSDGRSFLLTLIISLGQIPGTLLVALLVDRMHRRNLIIISLLLLSMGAFVFGLMNQDFWIVITGFLFMVFNGMAWAMGYSFSSELYPTRMRAAAAGWSSGIGRLGGVAAPLVIGWVVQAGGGLFHAFALLASAPLLAAVVLSGIRFNTTGKSLEEIKP